MGRTYISDIDRDRNQGRPADEKTVEDATDRTTKLISFLKSSRGNIILRCAKGDLYETNIKMLDPEEKDFILLLIRLKNVLGE